MIISQEQQMNNTKPYVISFCSGKRSVGKSVVAANISYLLANSGIKILLLDTDIQFPTLHLIYGEEPMMRINDILTGNSTISTAIHPIMQNLSLIAGSTGELSKVNENQFRNCLQGIIAQNECESIIFDCSFGVNDDVIECIKLSDMVIILISDEPSSVIDGYGVIKTIQSIMPYKEIRIIINNVIDKEDADETEQKLNRATAHFLSSEISSLGFVPYDRIVKSSIMRQELLAHFYPNSDSTLELRKIANAISEHIKTEVYV